MKRTIIFIVISLLIINMVGYVTLADSIFDDVVNEEVAEYIMSWQLDNGGWTKDKDAIFERMWDGSEKKAKYYQVDKVTPLGTIDNDATVSQLQYLAQVYEISQREDIKNSFTRGIEFLLIMQYDSGGFPQVYPYQDHGSSAYENDATFNDNAMINVLYLFGNIVNGNAPYNENLISEELLIRIEDSYYRGIDYVVNAQIVVDGKKTAWGGQHDPVTYETTKGRAFEPISIISKESVKIIKFLDNVVIEEPVVVTVGAETIEIAINGDTSIEEIPVVHELTQEAVNSSLRAAKEWVTGSAIEDTKYYLKGLNGKYFVNESGKLTWYRFYEIGTNEPLFGDVDGSVTHTITEISESRRHGYGWAGTWGKDIYREMLADDIIFDDEIPAALPELDADEEEFERLYEEELYRIYEEEKVANRNRGIAIIAFVSVIIGALYMNGRRS